jgi:hypothetical protein
MELTGHLTRSVFERYNITTDRDRRIAPSRESRARRSGWRYITMRITGGAIGRDRRRR